MNLTYRNILAEDTPRGHEYLGSDILLDESDKYAGTLSAETVSALELSDGDTLCIKKKPTGWKMSYTDPEGREVTEHFSNEIRFSTLTLHQEFLQDKGFTSVKIDLAI